MNHNESAFHQQRLLEFAEFLIGEHVSGRWILTVPDFHVVIRLIQRAIGDLDGSERVE